MMKIVEAEGGRADFAYVDNQTGFESDSAKRLPWAKIEAVAKKFGVALGKKLGDNGQLVDRESSHLYTAARAAREWLRIRAVSC
jgi:hypothetical protein